ncbi:MAG: preprotein translocase subunit TatC [bacterium]|nr:preprotein translocase subunit TatC [bacterium]
MSFGDHLEELRRCLVRGLIGVLVAVIVALCYSKQLLAIILQPLLIVLHQHKQPQTVTALSPPETFIAYLKVGFLSGLIVAMPWLMYQLWAFVAAGLYRSEQKFAKVFVPLVAGLFATGVAFLYYVVLPIVLNFFISFSNSVGLPELNPTWLQQQILAIEDSPATTQPAVELLHLPLLASDPPDPSLGGAWVNTFKRELRIMTEDGLLTTPLKPVTKNPAVTSQFALQFYISFVLALALAFGLAFELPIVVVFLSLIGIVSAADMAKGRKYVAFGIVIAAAVLTPPDVISQILLAIPMMMLFEAGLIVARILERRRLTESDA